MSKPIIRKHSAKVLSAISKDGARKFYALVGGQWYYCGNASLPLTPLSRMPNGIWRDSIADIIEGRSANSWDELQRYHLKDSTDIKVAIHHWTTEEVVPGVPF